HNVICDRATMQISLRTYDSSWRDFIVSRIQMLADHAAEELGGSVDCTVHYSSPAVVNDDQLVDCFVQASNTLLGDAGAREVRPKMGSDDFAWYTTKKPSLYYWLGVRNSARWPEKALHNNDFMLDEDALLIGEKLLIELLYTIGQNLNR
ncbi:MAG: amidohydrolase, partial [Clostridiaceae bacterium]|nr:amidohydrolase [Clostridiaceae bacterium]